MSLNQALKTDILNILLDFQARLNDSAGFSLKLKQVNPINNRQIYVLDRNDKPIYFSVQQASKIIRDIGEIESVVNRNSIIRALKESLNKKEFCLYKFDIKNFFDSIPHDKLLTELKLHPDFDLITEIIVKTLLYEYSLLTQKNHGLPQGVGLSSFLAEFYISQFDTIIKSLPGVLYYARYVDDVIVIIETESDLQVVKREIEENLNSLQLAINPNKTKLLTLSGRSASAVFEYLGYHFNINLGNKLETSLTQRRLDRKKAQLQKAFQSWEISLVTAKNRTTIDGLLIQRIRYLTGNTKLINSKNNATIGLFFSNSALDENSSDLENLNSELNLLINLHTANMTPELISKLSEIDFVQSFKDRTFYRFSQKKLRTITRIWQEHEIPNS